MRIFHAPVGGIAPQSRMGYASWAVAKLISNDKNIDLAASIVLACSVSSTVVASAQRARNTDEQPENSELIPTQKTTAQDKVPSEV